MIRRDSKTYCQITFSPLAWIVGATNGTEREGAGSCHLDKYEFLSPVYNPFNHTCYSVGRESSFELSTWPPRDVEIEKTCLLARALRALLPVTRFDSYTTGPTRPSSFSFFHLFARVIASSLRRSRSVSREDRAGRVNRDNVVNLEGLLCKLERSRTLMEFNRTSIREIEKCS